VKANIYQTITERFVELLKRGTVPWQKPWLSVQNLISQKPYRGINSLLLGSTDYQSPYWATFKQVVDLGGHVKKGETSTPVIYYKILEKRDEAGNAGFAACYSPKDDIIRIPAPSTFHSREDYYHTLYHEMIHASGHSSRLDREGITERARFGSERYCKEELIAELGAAFLSNEAGILDSVRFENSAAYLASWIQKLESDPRMIVSAASQAQRSSDFIVGIEHNESLQECQISPEGMPLTWAREHGIDTRIPGFAHQDPEGDGVSTLIEWKHGTKPTDRLSRPPHRQSLLL
jgi:antirestriction protein ArdC